MVENARDEPSNNDVTIVADWKKGLNILECAWIVKVV